MNENIIDGLGIDVNITVFIVYHLHFPVVRDSNARQLANNTTALCLLTSYTAIITGEPV